ncbi:MAG: hypothetical protein ACREDI_07370, partial [Roseiarcus sp.]
QPVPKSGSTSLTSSLAAYHDAQPCCSSFAALRYEKLAFPTEVTFLIDEKSQVFEFKGTGKSYVKAFELPAIGADYRLVLRSHIVRNGIWPAMFLPLVSYLDGEKHLIKTSDARDLHYSDGGIFGDPTEEPYFRLRAIIVPENPARYVVIHTSRQWIENGGFAAQAAAVRIAASSTPLFLSLPSANGPTRFEGSPVGDLTVRLERPR